MIELQDGGTLDLVESFFTKPIADKLFEVIKKFTPWEQEMTRFGHKFPRLTAYYADEGANYSYSGVTHPALAWPWYLTEVRNRIQNYVGSEFNSLLINYYRDGKDSIGFHSDNEKELGENPIVPSVSLGAEREFVIKHIKSKETLKYMLPHGSLLVMGGTMQHHWVHGLPKVKESGERINLTFRKIVPLAQR